MLLTFCWIKLKELDRIASSLGSDGLDIRFVGGVAAAAAAAAAVACGGDVGAVGGGKEVITFGRGM